MKPILQRLYAIFPQLQPHANSSIYRQQNAAKHVVKKYFNALNNNDLATLTSLFHEKSVLMPDNKQRLEGHENIKNSFDELLAHFDHQATLSNSNVCINGNLAVVESEAKVRLRIRETGVEVPVTDKDMFVLVKIANEWKIDTFVNNGNACYLNSTAEASA